MGVSNAKRARDDTHTHAMQGAHTCAFCSEKPLKASKCSRYSRLFTFICPTMLLLTHSLVSIHLITYLDKQPEHKVFLSSLISQTTRSCLVNKVGNNNKHVLSLRTHWLTCTVIMSSVSCFSLHLINVFTFTILLIQQVFSRFLLQRSLPEGAIPLCFECGYS